MMNAFVLLIWLNFVATQWSECFTLNFKLNISGNFKKKTSFGENPKCWGMKNVQNVWENFKSSRSYSLGNRIKSVKCKYQLQNLIYEMKNLESWALEIFDASSKMPSGLLTGNTFQFGNFDQCINAYSQKYSIKGKYCLASVHITPQKTKYSAFYKINKKSELSNEYSLYDSMLEKFKVMEDFTQKRRNVFHSGICVPEACSYSDAQVIANHFVWAKAREFGYHTHLSIQENFCTTNETKPLTVKGKILLSIIVGFVFFVLWCTSKDIFTRTKLKVTGKFKKFFQTFSLLNTTQKLCQQDGDGSMNVFNGMKSLSMVLIIMGHRCMASCGGPFFNPEFLEKRYKKIENILLLNGTLIVDTFFLIGGYLTFTTLFKICKMQKLKPLLIYFYRALRIMPLYILVIFFYAYLLEHMGTGPIWSIKIGKEAARCRKNWWTNILFINNYVNTDSLCMFQSWYVTCDMHFTLFAPFVVNIAAKSQKMGFMVMLSLITMSLLTSFFVTYYNKYDGVLRVYISAFEDIASSFTFNRVYIRTHNRSTPYFTGMAAAFLYMKLKQVHYKFSTWQIWFGSVFAVVLALSAICGAWLFYIPGREYNALENALYASFHRLFWALSMSWIALAGGTRAFGVIEPILSHKFFIPFSKLSYSAFLIHGAIQMYYSASLRVPEHMSLSKLGDQCKFRHQPLALGCETVCPLWLQHKCDNRLCKLRHMELKKNRKKIPCYWENQPGGCRKPHCPFLHKFPREPLVIGRETKECEQQVSSSQPPLDRGDWSRGGYEHPQGHIQVASDGDAAMLGPRRLSQGNVAPPAPGPVPDPLVVSFDDGMRLY